MATEKLENLYLPPMVKMQLFVFLFDTAILLYYFYQVPIWDKIKANFPALAYEHNSKMAPDCSSVVVFVILVLLSKVSFQSLGLMDYDYVSRDWPWVLS